MTPSTPISVAPRAGGCPSDSDSRLEPIAPQGLLVPNGGTLGPELLMEARQEVKGNVINGFWKMSAGCPRVSGSKGRHP